jgi:hypothetical protein
MRRTRSAWGASFQTLAASYRFAKPQGQIRRRCRRRSYHADYDYDNDNDNDNDNDFDRDRAS